LKTRNPSCETGGVSITQRQVWTGQEWLPPQHYRDEAYRYFHHLDQQNFSGDEPCHFTVALLCLLEGCCDRLVDGVI